MSWWLLLAHKAENEFLTTRFSHLVGLSESLGKRLNTESSTQFSLKKEVPQNNCVFVCFLCTFILFILLY